MEIYLNHLESSLIQLKIPLKEKKLLYQQLCLEICLIELDISKSIERYFWSDLYLGL